MRTSSTSLRSTLVVKFANADDHLAHHGESRFERRSVEREQNATGGSVPRNLLDHLMDQHSFRGRREHRQDFAKATSVALSFVVLLAPAEHLPRKKGATTDQTTCSISPARTCVPEHGPSDIGSGSKRSGAVENLHAHDRLMDS